MRSLLAALLAYLGVVAGAADAAGGDCVAREGGSIRDVSGCTKAELEILRSTRMIFFKVVSEPACRDADLSAIYYGRRLTCNISVAQFVAIGCKGPGVIMEAGADGLVSVALCTVSIDAVATFLSRAAPPP
ncbi:MAG: hypothetical protein JNK11_16235 [Alphaproteobacteria bacterium]|nr:hypothetical protein [Alphaproteobacteria bacterium]